MYQRHILADGLTTSSSCSTGTTSLASMMLRLWLDMSTIVHATMYWQEARAISSLSTIQSWMQLLLMVALVHIQPIIIQKVSLAVHSITMHRSTSVHSLIVVMLLLASIQIIVGVTSGHSVERGSSLRRSGLSLHGLTS